MRQYRILKGNKRSMLILLLSLISFGAVYAKQIPTVTGIMKSTFPGSPVITGSASATNSIMVTALTNAHDYNVQNTISLIYDVNTDTFFVNQTDVRIKITVNRLDSSGGSMPVRNEMLRVSINNKIGTPELSQSVLKLTKGYKVTVTIDSIWVNNISVSTLPRYVSVESDINMDRYFDFSSSATTTVSLNGITPLDNDCDGITDEIQVNWTPNIMAEEYQLEWTFVNNYSAAAGTYPASSFTTDFKNNSTRITTFDNSYKVSLLFYKGYIAFRVRAVGRDLLNPTAYIFGPWTSSDQVNMGTLSASQLYTVTAEHEKLKNWQYATTYAEEGKKKEVINYFDGSLHNRQTVTKINSDKNVIVGETMYDYQGRPAVNILPVPVVLTCTVVTAEPAIRYYTKFNVDDTNNVYSKIDFDQDGGSCNLITAPMDTVSGASQYYSNNNPNQQVQQSFLPHAKKFPFTQVEYTPDNTGRIRNQSGVGRDYQLGSGKETKYLYGQPNQLQVDRFFGSETGDASHYKKNVVIDANAQTSVTYLNQEGKTIATALAGVPPVDGAGPNTRLDSLDYANQNQAQFTIDLFNKNAMGQSILNTIPASNDRIEFTSQLLVPFTSQYQFNYNISIDTLQDPCLTASICIGCVYDLEMHITDECGNDLLPTVFPFMPVKRTIGKVDTTGGKLTFTMSCTGPALFTDTVKANLVLQPGVYTVSKILTVNQDAKNFFVKGYLDSANNTCIKTLSQFEAAALAAIDTSDCYNTCASCAADLGKKDDFVSSGRGTAAQYDFLLDQCLEPCRQKTLCQVTYDMMLSDVSPGGQYGKFNATSYSASSEPVSVFNVNNKLNPNLLSGNMANWQHPMLLLNNVIYNQYLDESGTRTKINLTQVSAFFYNPPVVNTASVYIDPMTSQPYTYPENLQNLSDFIPAWDAGWAKSLVTFHPEFAYYLSCSDQAIKFPGDNKSSDMFDSTLYACKTFSQAAAAGFINAGYTSTTTPAFNKIKKFWLGSGYYDPFFTNSTYQYSTTANPTTGSSTDINMTGTAAYNINLKTRINSVIDTYFVSGTQHYNMAQVAAMIARCGNNFSSTAPTPTSVCMGFGTDFYGPLNPLNDSVRDKEWRLFRQFYFAEKQKLQFQRMEFYAKHLADPNSNFYGGSNACIGNTSYNPYTAGMIVLGPFILPYPISAYFDASQPCGSSTFSNYPGLVKRFYDPANTGLSTANANLLAFQSTGQCPMALQVQNFLNAMATTKLLTDPTTFNLDTLNEFNITLYSALTGGTPPPSFVNYRWQLISAAGTTYTAHIIDPSNATVCTVTIDITGTGIPSFANITGITQLVYNTSSASPGAFKAVATYTIGLSVMSANITGKTCFDIKNCVFPPTCTPNPLAVDMMGAMNILKVTGAITSASPVSMHSDTTMNKFLTTTIKNTLGTPNAEILYKLVGTNQYTFYDSLNPGTQLILTITATTPSTATPNIKSYSNIRSNNNNLFRMDGMDLSLTKIADVFGNMVRATPTQTFALSMGDCGYADPPECAEKENQVTKDLGKLVNEVLTKNPFVSSVNLYTYSNFTPLLSSYFPGESSTAGTYTTGTGTSPNFDTLKIFMVDDHGILDCEFDLFHYRNNGTAYNFPNIVNVSGLTGIGAQDIYGNFSNFMAIATYSIGASTFQDTIYGKSCWPIRNCDCPSPGINVPPCSNQVQDSAFVFPTLPKYDNPCVKQQKNLAIANAQNAFQQYIDSATTAFANKYTTHCLKALENYTYKYVDKEYHVTLYYYDQAGNLIKTVPPEGIEVINVTSYLDATEQQIISDRTFNQQNVFTKHRMPTTYVYNSLNQLVYQSLPDHDNMDLCDGVNPNGLDTGLVINSLQFVTANKGYLSGYVRFSPTLKRGYAYTSNDAGNSWTRLYGTVAGDLQKVQYVNTTNGFAVSTFGMVLYTSDGGVNWDVSTGLYNPATGTRYVGQLTDLYFTSATSGFVGGSKNGPPSCIYFTTDGAKTFSAATVTGAVNGDTITGFGYDGANFLASSRNGISGKLFTSPTGSTWTQVSHFTVNNLKKVQYINNTVAFAVGDEGTLLKANPANVNWQLIPTRFLGSITDVYFKSATDGVALVDSVPGKAKIWKTFDGGITWQLLSANGDYYKSLQVYDQTNAKLIATGNNGLVAKILLTNAPFGIIKIFTPSAATNFNYADGVNNNVAGTLLSAVVSNTSIVYTSYNANATYPVWSAINTTTLSLPVPAPHATFKKVLVSVSNLTTPDIKAILLTTTGRLYSFYRPFNSATASCSLIGIPSGWTSGEFFNDISANTQNPGTNFYAYDTTGKALFKINFTGTGPNANGNPLGNSPAITNHIRAIAVSRSTNAMLMVGNTGGILYAPNVSTVTTASWTNLTQSVTPAAFNKARAVGSGSYIAVGIAGRVWRNFGTTNDYYLRNSGTTEDLNSMAVNTSGIGLVAADDGLLYKLSGAASLTPALTPVSTPVSVDLTDVAIEPGSGTSAYATAVNGKVIYMSSYATPTPVLASSSAVSAVNGVAYKAGAPATVVGNGVYISNYNSTFNVVTKNIFADDYIDAHFYDANNGFLIDSNDVIRRTADGGNSWSVVVPKVGTPALSKVYSTASGQAVIIGKNKFAGVINGDVLSPIPTSTLIPAGTNFAGIHFNSGNYGVIVGSSSRAMQIVPSGPTSFTISYIGQAIPSGVLPTFKAVHVFSDNSFLTAGTRGKIAYCKAGVFTAQNSYTPPAALTATRVAFNDIFFHDDYTGYVVGANGAAYKVSLTNSISAVATTSNTLQWTGFCPDAIYMNYTTNTQIRNLDFNAIAFSSRTRGMIVGYDSNIVIGSFTPNRYARLIHEQSGYYSTRFWYDKLGRLILSQNTKQFDKSNPANVNVKHAFSYTLYDALGRITEVGEKYENQPTMSVPSPPKFNSIFGSFVNTYYNNDAIDDVKFNAWISSTGDRREVTQTYYDVQSILSNTFATQNNLRKRVATATFEDVFDGNNLTYNHATHYSYDIHGNVSTLWQENTKVAVSGQNIREIDYTFDLISGKVNTVIYSPGQPDQFIHRYTYDADNRITKTETSKDNVVFETDAKYFYYAHGPLARVEYGKNQVQGMDYAYTLQGWIKGVNSGLLKQTLDMGRDGDNSFVNANANFARDVMGYNLGYYQGDYEAVNFLKWNNFNSRFEAYTNGSDLYNGRNDLFNGNISAMVTSISRPDTTSLGVTVDPVHLPQGNAYRYDQLNRIKRSSSVTDVDVFGNQWQSFGITAAGLNRNTFTYDANGNIKTQVKRDSLGNLVDSLVYHYEKISGKMRRNRLYHVNDFVTTTPSTMNDIKDQGVYDSINVNTKNNYRFDEIGNLVRDSIEEIDTINWMVTGKIKSIIRRASSSKDNLYFDYDAQGNRIAKHNYTSANVWKHSTYYIRDAQGNVMSVYDKKPVTPFMSYKLSEQHIYGSSRLGMTNPGLEMIGATASIDTVRMYLGFKHYELSNHLGNVLTTISDKKIQIGYTGCPMSLDFNSGNTTGMQTDNALLSTATQSLEVTPLSAFAGVNAVFTSTPGVTYNIQFTFNNNTTNATDGFVITAYDFDGTTYSNITNLQIGLPPNGVNSYTYTAGPSTSFVKFYYTSGLNVPTHSFYIDDLSICSPSSTPTPTVVDHFIADISSATDYYAFGQEQWGRKYMSRSSVYGMNGQEKDDEISGSGNSLDFGSRHYDPRLGRFLSVDPQAHKLPAWSSYAGLANNPISFFDGNGEFPYTFHIRAFAPPGAFKGFGFHDDQRGFSAQTTGVTSRIKQSFTIDPSKQTFSGGKPTSDPSILGGVSSTATDKGGLGAVGFAKKGDLATAATTSHFEGSNPFFLGMAPNISVSSAVSVTENVKAGTVVVAIDLASKQFPATEGIIQDSKGNSIFLAGAAAFGTPNDLIDGKETKVASVSITIGINDKGEFQNVTAGGKKYSIAEFNKLGTSKSAGPKPRADKDKK